MTVTSTPPGIPSPARLAGWISGRLGGEPAELADAQLIAGGRSNLTYRLTLAGPGAGPGTGPGAGSGAGPGTGPGAGSGAGPGTGLGTGPGASPVTGLGTGPGASPGAGLSTGPNGERVLVLRRPPLGHVLPTAHDMSREFRVLSGLAGTEVPVATPVAFCDDADIIGAPFYLMEHVTGWCSGRAQTPPH